MINMINNSHVLWLCTFESVELFFRRPLRIHIILISRLIIIWKRSSWQSYKNDPSPNNFYYKETEQIFMNLTDELKYTELR